MTDAPGMTARMNALTAVRQARSRSVARLPRESAERVTESVSAAESAILAAIGRERAALRAGRLMAADTLHLRLRDAARAYTDALRAARAVLDLVLSEEDGARDRLEARRLAFGNVLKIELATLAAARAAAEMAYADDRDDPRSAVA